MNLIGPLACGFPAAENGTADIYTRGTTTRATLYDSFEGDNPHTPSAGVTLDEHGGIEVYVSGYVDVVVKDSDGELVLEFTAGHSAANVEVRSQSFTGTNYESGASGASQPVALSTVLDLWLTSAGAIDFNVLAGGASTAIKDAIAAVAGLFFNVKAPAYGAKGDGSTDDTSAIAAANTAAQSSGGMMYFPAGTYRITSAISVGSKVSIMGAGAAASILTIDHGSNNALSYASASADIQTITGMSIRAAQANTGDMIKTAENVNLRLDSCHIGNSNMQGHCLECTTTDGGVITAIKCRFEAGTSTKHILTTVGRLDAFSCNFVFAAAAFNTICWDGVKGGSAYDCYIEANTVTSGTFTGIKFQNSSAKHCIISGCYFPAPAGGTFTAWQDSTTKGFREVGNTYGSGVAISCAITEAGGLASSEHAQYLSRYGRTFYVASTGGNITADGVGYGQILVKRTVSNADHSLDLDNGGGGLIGAGHELILQYYNNSGGNIANVTVLSGASGIVGMAGGVFAINNGVTKWFLLKSVVDRASGSTLWTLLGSLTV